MEFIKKYLLVFFLLINLTAEYVILMPISKAFFYVTLALGMFFMISPDVMSWKAYKSAAHLYLMGFIYVVYQFTVGYNYISQDSMLYLICKLVTFGIIVMCVNKKFSFYFEKFIIPFSYTIVVLIALGWIVNKIDYAGNIAFGFANRNAASSMISIAFAGFLFGTDKIKKMHLVLMAFCLASMLVSGSRNSLVMCILFVLVRYGVSFKLIVFMAVSLLFVTFVMPELGLRAVALERLLGTVSGNVSLDRENQRAAAMWMINQRPYEGWGFGAQMVGHARELSEMGSHNGYLDIIIYMGYPFGLTWIAVMVLGVLKRIKLYYARNRMLNFHIAVVISILFAANQEGYLTGVNQITTNLFFFSFTVLGVFIYRNEVFRNRVKIFKR